MTFVVRNKANKKPSELQELVLSLQTTLLSKWCVPACSFHQGHMWVKFWPLLSLSTLATLSTDTSPLKSTTLAWHLGLDVGTVQWSDTRPTTLTHGCFSTGQMKFTELFLDFCWVSQLTFLVTAMFPPGFDCCIRSMTWNSSPLICFFFPNVLRLIFWWV